MKILFCILTLLTQNSAFCIDTSKFEEINTFLSVDFDKSETTLFLSLISPGLYEFDRLPSQERLVTLFKFADKLKSCKNFDFFLHGEEMTWKLTKLCKKHNLKIPDIYIKKYTPVTAGRGLNPEFLRKLDLVINANLCQMRELASFE